MGGASAGRKAALILGIGFFHVVLLSCTRVVAQSRVSQMLGTCHPDCEPPARFAAGVDFLVSTTGAYLVGSTLLGLGVVLVDRRGMNRSRRVGISVLGQTVAFAAVVACVIVAPRWMLVDAGPLQISVARTCALLLPAAAALIGLRFLEEGRACRPRSTGFGLLGGG